MKKLTKARTSSDFQKAVDKAINEPTLIKALSFIALWESERVVRQAHEFLSGKVPRGPDGQGWDTCFEFCFNEVVKQYREHNQRNIT